MGVIRYIGRVCARAIPGSFDRSQGFLALVIVALWAAVDHWPTEFAEWLAPRTQGWPVLNDRGEPDMSGWQIALLFFALVAVVRLVWAASRLQGETDAQLKGERLVEKLHQQRETNADRRHNEAMEMQADIEAETRRKNNLAGNPNKLARYGTGRRGDARKNEPK